MNPNQINKESADSPNPQSSAENSEISTDETTSILPPKAELPPEVEQRLADWQRLWGTAATFHYYLGASSVAASAFAATIGGETGRYFAALAAVLTALIGFTQPQQRYFKFVNAWRTLDVAALRYKYGRLSLDNLFSALEKGEQMITEYENKPEPKPRPSAPGTLETPASRQPPG